jgi:phosphate starvation-inducible PhoH-like protein
MLDPCPAVVHTINAAPGDTFIATPASAKIAVPDDAIETFFGSYDEHLKQFEQLFDVQLRTDGHELLVTGAPEKIAQVQHVVAQLTELHHDGDRLSASDVTRAAQLVARDPTVDLVAFFRRSPVRTSSKRQIRAKSVNQQRYLDAIEHHDVVFGVGPAGTGKTYLAVAEAVAFLTSKLVSRIILARPAVEAGEKLGFLPGDLQEKVNPYLRPLYDALYDMLDAERVNRLLERGTIEIAPIAFMRGRTLNDAFVILDEAQNTTTEQMKMFLTRLGFGSKAVITGDVTQIDLPSGRTSGLVQAVEIVRAVEGIALVRFDDHDVVRHPMVQAIVRAYDAHHRATTAAT